ncbi:MAG: glycosyl hydrolase 115 family protein [Cyclobacteriaceae bacterium]|nr:glycosyl hydrolase 115 family protein [Cyclobacteriaceae bacterium]
MKSLLLLLLAFFLLTGSHAQKFVLSSQGISVPLYVSQSDFRGVIRAAQDLKGDIGSVTNAEPALYATTNLAGEKNIVLIGTIGKSHWIDELTESKRLDITSIEGKWESYLIQTIENPFPNVARALVIAGSDKRGTIFGIYEISKQIGVSPWHWWADVPVKKQSELVVAAERQTDFPRVKYRGIFINDEQPALGGWVKENYGGFNNKFYTRVFELILRLKGNFLWPAMWGQSFYTEDPLNPKLADEYGIVISTSHHEPMMRAHVEWQRANKGKWNYSSNEAALQEFWRAGITRMGDYESVVTLAMRGDGDEPMSEESNISLLQKIVSDQRKIITDITGKQATDVPQVWALYKEVQEYYDKGMRVPEDVTLLLCDDNWGNLRKLPRVQDAKRTGGYGIYYHFDYVGGPRNYKWINTNQIERVWEQMHLAYAYEARQIWIVNVGDIKPMEFPISFFLDYAWNPEAIVPEQLPSYTEWWCTQQFGSDNAKELAALLMLYTKYNSRVKPELLDAKTFSLENYNEFERVVQAYQDLASRANLLALKIPATQHEAYYQLIQHPVQASANLYAMYYYVALNQQAVARGELRANEFADKARQHYLRDSLITIEYHQRNNGKWNHMMSQTHIGYTYWQQPPVNKRPEVTYLKTGTVPMQTVPRAPKTARSLVPVSQKRNLFFEQDKYVAMEADHATRLVNSTDTNWKVIPNLGKTGSGLTTFPVTTGVEELSAASPHAEYEFYTTSTGPAMVQLYFSPTLNFAAASGGLRFAVSIDDETPQVISLNADDNDLKMWERWVANNIIVKTSAHQVKKKGRHFLRYWLIDPGLVLQKIVVDFGGVKPSNLGPPETILIANP